MSSESQQAAVSDTIWHLMKGGVSRSCPSCEHFNTDAMQCRLVGQVPPLETIIKGCEKYIMDIPF